MSKRMVEIEVKVMATTETAILINDVAEEVWLPKSQLEDWPNVGKTGKIVMPEWLAKDKELL